MDWKKILNDVGTTAATAAGAMLASTALGALSSKAPRIGITPKCTLHTPLALCMNKNCFYHAVDKQRMGLR